MLRAKEIFEHREFMKLSGIRCLQTLFYKCKGYKEELYRVHRDYEAINVDVKNGQIRIT
jgi:hypothetical protein